VRAEPGSGGSDPQSPPLRRRGAAPQTPLHKGLFVGSLTRYALASQWESVCGLGFIFRDGSKTEPGVIDRKSLTRTHVDYQAELKQRADRICDRLFALTTLSRSPQLSTIHYSLSTIHYPLNFPLPSPRGVSDK
jgi:hypothetical protein